MEKYKVALFLRLLDSNSSFIISVNFFSSGILTSTDSLKKSTINVQAHILMCSNTMCGRISQFFALKKCISPSSWKSWLIALLGMQIMRIEFIQCHHGKKKTQQKKYNFGGYFHWLFFCWREKYLNWFLFFYFFLVIIYCSTHFASFRALWGRSYGC